MDYVETRALERNLPQVSAPELEAISSVANTHAGEIQGAILVESGVRRRQVEFTM